MNSCWLSLFVVDEILIVFLHNCSSKGNTNKHTQINNKESKESTDKMSIISVHYKLR